METTYEYLGNEHFVDVIREAFANVLEQRGYHMEVGAAGPGGPHVYEFRQDNVVVAVKVDDRAGEKWEAELSVESEGHREELETIVTQVITQLLAELSTRLIESVVDEASRAKLAHELSRVIAGMA